jgi:methoxymalonate biosynthesis acyl carrier protein
MDVKATVREYLEAHIGDHPLEDDDDFFALGLVDSLFAMQLVMFVEMEFGIEIDSSEMQIDNFRTINAISGIVSRKTTSGVSA